MRKQVSIVGGETLGVRFTKREREIYGIEKGDILDLSRMVVIKKEAKK